MWCRQNTVFGRASEMSPAARQVLQRLGWVFLWFVVGVGHLVVGGMGVAVMGGAGFKDASSSAASQFLTHCWWARVSVLSGLASVLLFGLAAAVAAAAVAAASVGKRGDRKSGLGLQSADGCACGGGGVVDGKGGVVCCVGSCRGASGVFLR